MTVLDDTSMSETVRFMWRDGDDGWRVAVVKGHEIKLRQLGPHIFEFSVDGQGRSGHVDGENPFPALQKALERTALKLPPR